MLIRRKLLYIAPFLILIPLCQRWAQARQGTSSAPARAAAPQQQTAAAPQQGQPAKAVETPPQGAPSQASTGEAGQEANASSAAPSSPVTVKDLADLARVSKLAPLSQHVIPGGASATVEIKAQAPVEATNVYLWGFEEDDGAAAQQATLVASGQGKTTLALAVPTLDLFWPWQVGQTLVLGSFRVVDGKLDAEHPNFVVREAVSVRAAGFAAVVGVLAAAFAYLLAVLALGRVGSHHSWDPVYLTSDTFDRASLSQLQVFCFTLLVFGLLVFVLLRTGIRSDISPDILLLLGISAVGAAGSKTADTLKTRLTFENWSWLRNQGWLTVYEEGTGIPADQNRARWGDLLKTGQSFDIYSFQLVVFSALVAFELLSSNLQELATFTIPQNLLGLLGLSNVVYIGGKAVTPNSLGDLDKKVTDLRDAEQKWMAKVLPAVLAAGTPQDKLTAAKTAGPPEYQAYIADARETARMLKAVYGPEGTKFTTEPIQDGDLLPASLSA